ncbi:hypothetical protein ACX0G9_00430 [Flavitalea flava]
MNDSSIQRFYHFIYRHFYLFFWPVFAAAFIVAFIQLRDKAYLTNESAPNGIVSMELGWTSARDTVIIQSWQADTHDPFEVDPFHTGISPVNRLRIARDDIYLDYLFILLYTFLAIIIITSLQTKIKKSGTIFSNILLLLAVLAGLCDAIENLGLLHFINRGLSTELPSKPPIISLHLSPINAWITSLAASIKFGILFFLLCLYLPFTLIFKDQGLVHLTEYLQVKTRQLFRYRVILIGVVAFATPVWILDQGQDLLINSNSSKEGVFLFLAVVVIAAFLNWYLAKLFFEPTYTPPVYPVKEPEVSINALNLSEKKVSRFLGILTIILPAVAILNALQTIRIRFWMDLFPPMIWLAGLITFFFVVIKYDVAGKAYLRMEINWGKPKAALLAIIILLFLGLILPGFIRWTILKEQSVSPTSLFFLFFHLLLLSFAFYIFVSIRSFVFMGTGWLARHTGWLGKKIGWPVILSSGCLALLFVLLNRRPLSILSLDCNYLSLPVLLSGIIFYILLLTLLIRFSQWRKINFVLFFLVIGLVISITRDNPYHTVNPMTVRTEPEPDSLGVFFKQWILHRKDEIKNAKTTYPVFLVNTYGGGIRAAVFTNMVLSYLDSVLIENGKGFEHFVFSISGASGGTVGAALQCAYRSRHLDSSSAAYKLDTFRQFYQHDFLTPVLSNALGKDIWAAVSGLDTWQDRSAIQEYLWEGFAKKTLHLDLHQEFSDLWDPAKNPVNRLETPLLFSNTLNVDDGLKGIMAPVSLSHSDFPATIFIRERIRTLNRRRKKDNDSLQSLSLMTGAFLSARFPFISPSGMMGAGYHFMDGGAKDNSGASTSENIMLSLARYCLRENNSGRDSTFSNLLSRVRFYFVSITNNPYFDPNDSTRRLVSNRFEPISPLVGLINSGINGNASAADSALRFRYAADSTPFLRGIHVDYCSVWPTAVYIRDQKGIVYAPLLPLGWQISAPSMERLRLSFTDNMINQYDPIGIRKILDIFKNYQ